MKLTHVFATLLLFAGVQSATNAQFMLGGGISYGTEVEAIGIQPRAIYSFTEVWRGGADFNFYLDGDEGVSYWDLNLNAHYIFLNNDNMQAYALAGINYFKVNFDSNVPGFDASASETGLNLGAGLHLPFGPLNGLLEARYVLGDADQLVISAGILFPLGGN